MEFQILVDGKPVTEWEHIRARDVDLWIDSLNLERGTKVSVASRKTVKEGAVPLDLDAMSRDELIDAAADLGIAIQTGATKPQIRALIDAEGAGKALVE